MAQSSDTSRWTAVISPGVAADVDKAGKIIGVHDHVDYLRVTSQMILSSQSLWNRITARIDEMGIRIDKRVGIAEWILQPKSIWQNILGYVVTGGLRITDSKEQVNKYIDSLIVAQKQLADDKEDPTDTS